MHLLVIAIALALLCQPSVVAQQQQVFTYTRPGLKWHTHQKFCPVCPTCKNVELNDVDAARLLNGVAKNPPSKRKPPAKKRVALKPKRKVVIAKKVPPPIHRVVSRPKLRAVAHKTEPRVQRLSTCEEVVAHAQALINQHREEEADQYIKAKLVENPQDKCIATALVNWLMHEAYKFMECGEIECAARRLREVLFIQPLHLTAREYLDKCYKASGIEPANFGARLDLANRLLNKGRTVGSFVEYERLVKSHPTAGAYLGVARSAQRLAQNQLAVNSYKQALALNPHDNNAWRELGILQAKLGDDESAKNSLLQALKLQSADVLAGETLTSILKRKVENAPNDPAAHLQLAEAYQLSGMTAQANAEYGAVASLSGNNPGWQQKIVADRQQADAWRQQSAITQQALAAQAQQKAFRDFEEVGPIPSTHPPNSKGCVNCHNKQM